MKFNFILFANQQTADIPTYIKAWITYHVTKHILVNCGENFDDVLKLDENYLMNIRNQQIKESKLKNSSCRVGEKTQPCHQCSFKEECYKLLDPISKKYIHLIQESIKNDFKKPRHLRYKNNGKRKFVMITKKGMMIISQINTKNNIIVKSCYRSSISHLDEWKQEFIKKASGDDRWYLNSAIKKWKWKMHNNDISEINFHLNENWVCL